MKPKTFTQTAATALPDLDRWQQVGEDEARIAYEMTLRNELSGGTPVVREFEAKWRELTGLKHALTTVNGPGRSTARCSRWVWGQATR